MSFTKYATLESAQVLELKSSPQRAKQASLSKMADFNDYRTEDGYLYARIRAISSRVNKNHDGWPTAELAGGPEAWEKESSRHEASEGGFSVQASKGQKYGFSTFLGKPNFIDHHNSDPKRARGVVVDASFHVLDQKTAAADDDYWGGGKVDPEHNPPSEVELLIEVDAKTFPKYAKAIVDGDLDGFSMGCDVDYSKCSHCDHRASSPDEYCSHITSKGAEFDFTSSDGETSSKKSYENCYGISFFEISGVFDPADETALTKDIRSEGSHNSSYLASRRETKSGPKLSGINIAETALRGTLDNGGVTINIDGAQPSTGYAVALNRINELVVPVDSLTEPIIDGYISEHINELNQPNNFLGTWIDGDDAYIDISQVFQDYDEGMQAAINGNQMAMYDLSTKKDIPVTPRDQVVPREGSYLSARRVASIKTAQPDEPQVDHVHAPEEVNTTRKETICPLCGSDMEDGKCEVCGYEEPPESLQNPDLTQVRRKVEELQQGQENKVKTDPLGKLPGGGPNEETYLKARNPVAASTVNSEMRWAPKLETSPTTASSSPGDEPNETVTSDQIEPVTSALRTAKEMIKAAKRNPKRNTMSNKKKVAAQPADPSGSAKNQVDVTGTGGVDEASAEAASKADKQVDVCGKGGVIEDSNAAASAPDKNESLPSGEQDNAGFQSGGPVGESTKTFPNSNEPDSAVTNKAFPTAANHGTQPADPVGKAQDRIDVETPPHDQVGDKTDTWSGTSGNGVTKQQEAVTSVPTQSGGIKASGTISLAALKLADAEVELGITDKNNKYNRLAELAELPEEEVQAEHRALARVKTAGLSRTASAGGVSRLPSFQRIASEETSEPQPVNDALLDSAVFTR